MTIKSLIPFGFGSMTTGTDPFGDLRREMDRLFDDFAKGRALPEGAGMGFLTPKVNVAETEAGLEMTAELPGCDRKDIELGIADGVLTLEARREVETRKDDEKTRNHLVERATGTYVRRILLPFAAREDAVEAVFDKGVLKVTVPRAAIAAAEPKKIELKAA